MIRLVLTILLLILHTPFLLAADYAVARSLTPVLSTPDFSGVFGGYDGNSLRTDRCGQVRELEFIALPGTTFKIVKEIAVANAKILQVETTDYQTPPGIRLYIDSRFAELSKAEPPPRRRQLPAEADIITFLKASIGAPYVWGGNALNGLPELAESYFKESLSAMSSNRKLLAGLDCSGLLYQATNGWTPRNTAQLLEFGRAVHIDGKTPNQLEELLQPLDLIVWNGHVIIILDRNTAIESVLQCGKKGNGGVVTSPLLERLREIMRTRRPMDAWPAGKKQRGAFVVRRWL